MKGAGFAFPQRKEAFVPFVPRWSHIALDQQNGLWPKDTTTAIESPRKCFCCVQFGQIPDDRAYSGLSVAWASAADDPASFAALKLRQALVLLDAPYETNTTGNLKALPRGQIIATSGAGKTIGAMRDAYSDSARGYGILNRFTSNFEGYGGCGVALFTVMDLLYTTGGGADTDITAAWEWNTNRMPTNYQSRVAGVVLSRPAVLQSLIASIDSFVWETHTVSSLSFIDWSAYTDAQLTSSVWSPQSLSGLPTPTLTISSRSIVTTAPWFNWCLEPAY